MSSQYGESNSKSPVSGVGEKKKLYQFILTVTCKTHGKGDQGEVVFVVASFLFCPRIEQKRENGAAKKLKP